MTQPIQAVQICYEHPFGTEREVLKALFLYVLYEHNFYVTLYGKEYYKGATVNK